MANDKPSRNDPCPCGSGKKYKHCCMNKTENPAAAKDHKLPIILASVAGVVSIAIMWAADVQTGLAFAGATMLGIGGWAIFRNPPPPRDDGDHPASINFGG